MKLRTAMVPLLFLAACVGAKAQATFVYDQQSSTNESPSDYGSGGAMQQIQPPWGQSFTPVLNSVGFIRLKFADGNRYDGLGATVYLNLRSDSITGPILGTTASVTMPSDFRGTVNFFFPDDVSVVPGVMYYFEPTLVSGGFWNMDSLSHVYPGGTVIAGGVPVFQADFWFREGIVIPEPATGALLWLGLAGLLACRRARSSPQAL